ncbi:MAG: hypothetical protein E3J87_09315 [Candidatus Cloacimonadota bacterium]|nr:MAG: hypothetical protein E3J87_09315 [Candidatus Cloacimonadota bacterium]
MPELPELEVIKNILAKDITGKEICCPVFTKPYILKGFFNGYGKFFPSRIEKIERKGKYLLFHLTNKVIIVIHLSPSFTESYLKAQLLKERKQLKIFLKDQNKIAGIGNAYANEILWDAQLSPFKSSDSLTARDVKKLFSSIRKVLRNGIKEIEKRVRGKLFIKEPRDFMIVHNKKDAPCPGCENKIEWVYSKKNTTYYCPHCQTKGKIYKDRRLSRFLK